MKKTRRNNLKRPAYLSACLRQIDNSRMQAGELKIKIKIEKNINKEHKQRIEYR